MPSIKKTKREKFQSNNNQDTKVALPEGDMQFKHNKFMFHLLVFSFFNITFQFVLTELLIRII